MSPQEIIREVEENAGEWLEMSENPAATVAGILAQKIVNLNSHIEYLERSLRNESRIHIN